MNKNRVLIIGAGGREHAIAWKLKQSPNVGAIFVAPGNGGISQLATIVPLGLTDVEGVVKFSQDNNIDFVVVAQDDALAAGMVDALKDVGISAFGPSKAAAQIEASKAFSKDLMKETSVPTASYETFTNPEEAKKYTETCNYPTVVKASGLAAGKGVIICDNHDEALSAIDEIMGDKIFGKSGDTIVIEDFLAGKEISVHALTDGKNAAIFPTSQDHKQVFDGDKGPNTGGMGVIAPVDWAIPYLDEIEQKVVKPILEGLESKGAPFVGCLYPGLMIDGDNIKTLEFNARFGDPETEVYMRLLDADLFEVFKTCVDGTLDPSAVKWRDGYAATIILASGGYPGDYKKGIPISGIDDAEQDPNVIVFHAGTKKLEDGTFVTAGGRVLNVTATGSTLDEALKTAYDAVNKIHFEGMHYRTDIGRRV